MKLGIMSASIAPMGWDKALDYCRELGLGAIELPCQAAKGGELPPGLLFLPYGDLSSRLMGGDTSGTGMPSSKGFDVELEKV